MTEIMDPSMLGDLKPYVGEEIVDDIVTRYNKEKKSCKFITMIVIMSLSFGAFFYYIMNFKAFALLNFSEKATTAFSPIVVIAVMSAKILTGLLIDKLGWKYTCMITVFAGAMAALILHWCENNIMLFYFTYYVLYYAESSVGV
jgi:hypothetical protein